VGKLLTISEVALELRVSERTIRKRIARGDLPAWRLGPEQDAPVRRVPAFSD
jgi:excisionase family DNA binding protein